MFSDNKMVLNLLSLLKQNNIRRIVISPGSRHFAFVHSLEADPFFKLYSVVDERSAAFFAIGLIQQTGETVVVTCSSGTACMNYGSGVVEAYYQKLPLLVISSDRVSYFLNQNEDQMYDQISTFTKCTKYHAQLPVIKDELDEWYCNRIINEGIIALTHRGRGPVHLNIPFLAHHTDTFSTLEIPMVRKISMNKLPLDENKWISIVSKLKGKKVMVLWGQSVPMTESLREAITEFTNTFDAIILTDKISNCHHESAIDNTTVALAVMKPEDKTNLQPDVVISIGGNYIFNGEIKNYLKSGKSENWLVGPEGEIVDAFHTLTEVFDMDETTFFSSLVAVSDFSNESNYRECWKILSTLPPTPTPEYNEMYAIGQLLNNLPENCDLQLANSCTIRMSHFFPINPKIRVNCNRGVNGIDGSMSTAVGFGADNDNLTYYITGDLSFFYDMNSLWIRHLNKKMRIMLINNGGGAVMYAPLNDQIRKTLPKYVAAGHTLSAKGWAESVGFKYFCANNKEETDFAIEKLCDSNISEPIFVEIFTTIEPDINTIRDYMSSIRPIPHYYSRIKTRAKKEINKILTTLNIIK